MSKVSSFTKQDLNSQTKLRGRIRMIDLNCSENYPILHQYVWIIRTFISMMKCIARKTQRKPGPLFLNVLL